MAQTFAAPATNLVSKLVEYLFAIGRQFGYVLRYKSDVKDLKEKVDKLKHARKRVQRSVEEAKKNGKPVENDIRNWLESVKNMVEEAEDLLEHGQRTKDAFFRGWLPNPAARHPTGRKVKKMIPVIQALHEESKNNNFKKFYFENTSSGIVSTHFLGRSFDNKEDVLDSRVEIAEEVMKAIVDDKVCVVGVWGVGGVGKSKLAEDVGRRVKEQKLFDVVAKANISRNPNLKEIQGEIAYALGLKLIDEETAYGRADSLRRRLESVPKKNILIILDNLWEKLELKEIGIPCEDDNKVKGCKLLITSRKRHVLRIDMSSDREVRLNELEHGEARTLFESIVGDRDKDPDYKNLVDEVVRNCGGLPLLILSMAKRLRHGDSHEWSNPLTNLERSDVKAIVELNYKDLKGKRMRWLFMFCAMTFGKIYTADVLGYCMGLGLLKKIPS